MDVIFHFEPFRCLRYANYVLDRWIILLYGVAAIN